MGRKLRPDGLRRGCGGWHREHFVELAVNKFHRDLNSVESVFAGEINGALRMLEVVRLERVGGPVSQTTQAELRTDVLQHNLHSNEARTGFVPDLKDQRQCVRDFESRQSIRYLNRRFGQAELTDKLLTESGRVRIRDVS